MIQISLLLIILVGVHGITIEYGQPKAVTKYGNIYGNIRKISIERERGCLECPDKSIFFFKGVPYAKPPVGNLRFEYPEPPDHFGTLNATTWKIGCTDFMGVAQYGQEDCLYMNIATPSFPPPAGKKFPVMVLIFGGAYIHGDANEYQSPDFQYRFVTRGIVFFSFHYRVGPFGFYTSTDSSSSGNYALWDQLQALKFVQEVVGDFNGDPNSVTIFGNSAGGGSVSWLTYSYHAKGLFKQALPYCGMSHSSTSRSNNTFAQSKELEDKIGCGSAKNKKECLKAKSKDEIWEISHRPYMQKEDTIFYSWWSPIFDGQLFTGHNWLEAADTAPVITMMYGVNSNEEAGLVIDRVNYYRHAKYYPLDQVDAEVFGRERLIDTLSYLVSVDNFFGNRTAEAAQKVVDYYLTRGDQNPTHKYLQAYTQFETDLHFGIGAIREAKQKVKLGNRVYFYLNDYSVPDYPFSNPLLKGSGHCAENPYLYGNWTGLEPPSDDEGYDEYKQVQRDFVDMWISFVKYGIPSHTGKFFSEVTPHRVPYAWIRKTTVMKENLWRESSAFWELLAREYGFDFVTGFPDPY